LIKDVLNPGDFWFYGARSPHSCLFCYVISKKRISDEYGLERTEYNVMLYNDVDTKPTVWTFWADKSVFYEHDIVFKTSNI